MADKLRLAYVTSEVAPWCKTGGLADVGQALPSALAGFDDVEVVVVAPLCRGARVAIDAGSLEVDAEALPVVVERGGLSREVAVRVGLIGDAWLALIEEPALFERAGLYGEPGGADYDDNPARFATLVLAALEIAPTILGGVPDIVHANDWQTGLGPLLVRERWPEAASVFTIHNLAYQGLFDKSWMQRLDLDWSLYQPDGVEFWDQLSFLKAGIAYADAVTTVSPRYAQEIREPALSHGLDGFLRAQGDRLSGILNGVDREVWNPATDPHLAAVYSGDDLGGKAECRAALVAELGLDIGRSEPLLGMVTRLAEQKGIDLVLELIPELDDLGARLVLLGVGDAELERALAAAAAEHPEHFVYRAAFDEALSHRIHAGADILLMPSRFEPCGLNQMYAMAYGTVPIVHEVGGLADTVVDATAQSLALSKATGFTFQPASAEALRAAATRACRLFRAQPDVWARVVHAGMERDAGWERPAREYRELYLKLAAAHGHGG